MRSSAGGILRIAAVAALGATLSAGAEAAPVNYFLTPGPGSRVTTIQLVDISPPITPTPCPVGSGNCLANAPVPITGAFVTVDLAAPNALIDLDIFVSGPMILDLNGLNGYEQVTVNGASYQMNPGPFALAPVGSQYNFAAPGTVSATTVELFFLGNPGPVPDAVLPFGPAPTTPTGNIQFGPGSLTLTLTGVDLGVFADPLTGGNPVLAKADFVFTAAVPEPGAPVLFAVALLVAGTAGRRRVVLHQSVGSWLRSSSSGWEGAWRR
jgi:hypothetical protein